MTIWTNVKDKPAPTDGTKVDVWCKHPVLDDHLGVRFTDVSMRGDGSGFGFIIHTPDKVLWEYVERAEGVYPEWIITYWAETPLPPHLQW